MTGKKAETEEEVRTLRERLWIWLNRFQFLIYSALVLVLIVMGYFWKRTFIVIPAGHLGVLYRPFYGGTVTKRSWGEGIHVVLPWNTMTIYDIRMQRRSLEFRVLSEEGLSLGIQIAVRFRLNQELLGYLQRDIGTDYFERLIQPEIESHVRNVFGNHPAHEIYATVREVFQELGQFSVIGRFEKMGDGTISRPYVNIQDVKLVTVELPKIVENAVLEKYQQEQLLLAYKYKLTREEKEADRKRTEAAGIRDFGMIAGKTVDIKTWRSLDVASELAKSPNAKFVLLGGGQGTLPMILNLGESGSPPPVSAVPEKSEPASPGEKNRPTAKAVTHAAPPAVSSDPAMASTGPQASPSKPQAPAEPEAPPTVPETSPGKPAQKEPGQAASRPATLSFRSPFSKTSPAPVRRAEVESH